MRRRRAEPAQRPPPKGWNRASFDFATAPVKPKPPVTARDFAVPLYRDWLPRLGMSLAFGLAAAPLWIWFPLFVIEVLRGESFGGWLWVAMAGGALVAAAAVFVWSTVRACDYLEM